MIPIFPGRFQPFHNGHLWIVQEMLTIHNKAVIAIVNPNPEASLYPDYETFHRFYNPFNYWDRLMQIKKVLKTRNVWNKVNVIPLSHPRYSAKRDRTFLPKERVWYIPPLDEHEEEKIADFIKQGENVEPIEVPRNLNGIRSSMIRNCIFLNKKCGECYPKEIFDLLWNDHVRFVIKNNYTHYPDKAEKSLRLRCESLSDSSATQGEKAPGQRRTLGGDNPMTTNIFSQRINDLHTYLIKQYSLLSEIEKQSLLETRPKERLRLIDDEKEVRDKIVSTSLELETLSKDTETLSSKASKEMVLASKGMIAQAFVSELDTMNEMDIMMSMGDIQSTLKDLSSIMRTAQNDIQELAKQKPSIDLIDSDVSLKDKLKVTVPLIPLFLQYESEISLEGKMSIKRAWDSIVQTVKKWRSKK